MENYYYCDVVIFQKVILPKPLCMYIKNINLFISCETAVKLGNVIYNNIVVVYFLLLFFTLYTAGKAN